MIAVLYSFGSGITRPAVTSLITQVAPPNRRGGALGVSTSLDSLSRSIAPIVGGWIIGAIHPNYIGYVGCILAAIGALLAFGVHTDSHEVTARG
jgi:MFS family permease